MRISGEKMPFPVIKLGYLAIKQVAKPMANAIKRQAKDNPLLRKMIYKPAQIYHSIETKVKMRLLGLGQTVKDVKPLNEDMAVELGAEMLGELVIFSVGAGIIAAEYSRQARKEQHKEDVQNDRLKELEETVSQYGILVEQQSAEIRELSRLVHSLNIPVKNLPRKITDSRSGTVLHVEKGP